MDQTSWQGDSDGGVRWLAGKGASNFGGTVCSVILTEALKGSRPDSKKQNDFNFIKY